MRKMDLTGERFGRLTVKEELKERKNGKVCWLCKCDCGNYKGIKANSLKSGSTLSCGCLLSEIAGKMKYSHGHKENGITTKTYAAWNGLRQRCNNPKSPAYKNYGGRGITFCKRWSKFENFLKDMGEAPKNLTLERIDNDGNYEPGNCKWATRQKQEQNNRGNKLNPLRVVIIKKLLQESRLKQYEIAEIFKLKEKTICKINTGKLWGNINYWGGNFDFS